MNDGDAPDTAESMLQKYLQDRTVLCPNCEYDLRNLQANRCPECGSELELGIRLTEPRIGWLLAGLSGLVTGAGFSSLIVVFFVISILVRGQSTNSDFWRVFFGYALLPAIVQICLISLYLRKWRAIRQMPSGKRRTIVFACWAVPIVNIVVFSLNIR